jgi:hypothetical protein
MSAMVDVAESAAKTLCRVGSRSVLDVQATTRVMAAMATGAEPRLGGEVIVVRGRRHEPAARGAKAADQLQKR